MIWYEIAGIPGYRINHHGEVLSTRRSTPRVMKAFGGKVRLRHNGEYVTYDIATLMTRAHLKPHLRADVHVSRCVQGHPFTPQNTMKRKGRHGDIRKCRECHRLAMARWRAKKKAQG